MKVLFIFKSFMCSYIYRTRSSWIICEAVTYFYAYVAFNCTKPWILAYVFILCQLCRPNFI